MSPHDGHLAVQQHFVARLALFKHPVGWSPRHNGLDTCNHICLLHHQLCLRNSISRLSSALPLSAGRDSLPEYAAADGGMVLASDPFLSLPSIGEDGVPRFLRQVTAPPHPAHPRVSPFPLKPGPASAATVSTPAASPTAFAASTHWACEQGLGIKAQPDTKWLQNALLGRLACSRCCMYMVGCRPNDV